MLENLRGCIAGSPVFQPAVFALLRAQFLRVLRDFPGVFGEPLYGRQIYPVKIPGVPFPPVPFAVEFPGVFLLPVLGQELLQGIVVEEEVVTADLGGG